MNKRQLEKLGVPKWSFKQAVSAIQTAVKQKSFRGNQMKAKIQSIVENPDIFIGDEVFGDFANSIIEANSFQIPEPIKYRTWGEDIDTGAHAQMRESCQVPSARKAALMPDAHIGYGLPIGGVLGLEGAIIPYAVGVDIACRMKISVLDVPVDNIDSKSESFRVALESGTRFGVGVGHEKPQDHAVLDADWTVSKVTRQNKDKARKQLGTSGSGNHFVEFGELIISDADNELNLEPGKYVALMSHSGSRGTGASVCSTYSSIAQSQLHPAYKELGRLAWLDMNSTEGQEYWAAMNLMGDYASANHAVIHRLVTKSLGSHVIAGVENHHNFAWKEMHDGKELIVHRKGATPAGKGVLGVIPGSMADPAFIVRGKGKEESLDSASHGAGRRMSRTKGKEKYNFKAVKNDLAKKGITVLSAGADEVPGVYKNIEEVMAQQKALVDIVARFNPRIVKMCGDGSKAED